MFAGACAQAAESVCGGGPLPQHRLHALRRGRVVSSPGKTPTRSNVSTCLNKAVNVLLRRKTQYNDILISNNVNFVGQYLYLELTGIVY